MASTEVGGVGVADGHGYHETVTRYFVEAVAHAPDASLADLHAHPSCRRDAPLAHWTAALLASEAARRSWVPPDLRPLAWRDRPPSAP